MEDIKNTFINWLDAMDKGLALWCQFTVLGRIKTEEEARNIESALHINAGDIEQLESRVKLMGSRDMMMMAQSMDEINKTEILLSRANKELERWEQTAIRTKLADPVKMVWFCKQQDNDEYVNSLNEKLYRLFVAMHVAITNFKALLEKEEEKFDESKTQEEDTDKGCSSKSNAPEHENSTDADESEITLRSIFGEHLNQFLKEARACKKGSDVARLVHWYVREYRLKPDKTNGFNKPLWEALQKKGIETASISTWNNTIR